jgi:uncharacterized protein YjgD (DUF1641 family)
MSMDKPEESGITSKNPLLRKIAQLESAEKEKNKESGIEDAPKLGVDLLRDHIVEETIKRHPLATREEILQGMSDMGYSPRVRNLVVC